ncbi:uncharacterized protein LOC111614743 [Centruroides sculpturatus]|uniref:uncharacterized protein LOC111614743 n=1 Tax=Centruroides sculpturatus TaxID=218467 RepID=UPI000C6D1254|nr:uncharacterized protein LOC111614743 [Centruroides sculpturatus]
MINHVARNSWGLSSKHCKLIYTSAIEPALLYATELWGNRASIVHNHRKLASIQRGFAIRICKAYRTAPTDALLTIANLVPINIKIKTRMWKWHLMNGRIHDLTNDKIQELINNNQIPNSTIVNTISRHGIDHYYKDYLSKSHPATSSSNLICEINNPTEDNANWHAYTDGASNELGTGSAFVIYDMSTNRTIHEQYHKLSAHCTNNQAELWAMYKALSHITRNLRRFPGSIGFFTDSKYVLSVIRGAKKLTATGIKLYHLAINLNRYRNITFSWIPGHSNIQGYDRADCLAKRAAEIITNPSFELIPPSYINNHIHEKSIDIWEMDWNSSTTGRMTHGFLPSIRKRQNYSYITPSFYLSQCLTGHGNIPSYLHRIGKRRNDKCTCDNSATGDIYHILLDCPFYDTSRQELKLYCTSHGQPWPPDLTYLCAHKDSYNQLIKFINLCDAFKNNFSPHPNKPEIDN